MKNFLGLLVLLLLAYLAFDRLGGSRSTAPASPTADASAPASRTDAPPDAPRDAPQDAPSNRATGDAAIANAFRQQRSDVAVSGEGVVTRVLADDHDGSPHQRFLLALGNGQTVLVAHNIELAPRIAGLQEGDRVAFAGEYVWNDKGGVIHWTHRDPRGGHPAGWLRHAGRLYQ